MIILNRSALKSKWFEYSEGVSFLVRPFPLSERALTPSGSNIIEVLIKQALYCLVDWKGVVDENEQDIKCNGENKKFIFDYSDEIIYYICEKSKEVNQEVVNLPLKKT